MTSDKKIFLPKKIGRNIIGRKIGRKAGGYGKIFLPLIFLPRKE